MHEDHTKNYARENLRDRKKRVKDISQSGVKQRVRNSSPKRGAGQSALRRGSRRGLRDIYYSIMVL